MNKKAKRRAFLVCATIFVLYVVIGSGLTDKLSMRRITAKEEIKATPMGLAPVKIAKEKTAPVVTVTPAEAAVPPKAAPETRLPAEETKPVPVETKTVKTETKVAEPKPLASVKPETPPKPVIQPVPTVPPVTHYLRDNVAAEPNLFIAVPVVCYAIKAGLIEKEGLIFIKKGGYNNPSWKKPLDILKDKDEEGLRSISKAIGKKQILVFLKNEGIIQREGDGLTEDVILGRGYGVEKKRLLGLYDRHVSADYQKFFPFFLDGVGIAKGRNGFEVIRTKDVAKERRDDGEEWMMPNLTHLTIRDAITKVSSRTSKIKVFGSGTVTDQQPKPFQRNRGETECVIYGRTDR